MIQMLGWQRRLRLVLSLSSALAALSYASTLSAQSEPDTRRESDRSQPSTETFPAADQDHAPSSWAEESILKLGHSSYRTRQMARSQLEENPQAALVAIEKLIKRVDVVTGVQLVEILSGLAGHADIKISDRATQILTATADKATNVGLAATNSLSAISDLQEEKATEILVNLGAVIGPQNFSINGRVSTSEGPWSLRIDEQFLGTDQDFDWIRYLKSVKVVYLRGSKIPACAIEALGQLKGLQAIKLRSVALTREQLVLFQNLFSLEHLGLSYMDVDDSYLPEMMQLPISHSIRLYGTKVSAEGAEQLAKRFDGLEIFRGSGGFLGISSVSRQAQVEQVTPGSAASRAGIRHGDIITAINDIPIQTFDELRRELGKYQAEETVLVRLTRYRYDGTKNDPEPVEMTVKATLQEESN